MRMSLDFIVPRLLQDQGANSTDPVTTENVTQILSSSLRIYGSIFAFGFIVYCYVRKRFPRTFAVRQWKPELVTPLAQDQFGYLSWMWKVYSFSQEELLETIGLDALCLLRVLNMGFRLSCFGCVSSLILIPVYATSNQTFQNDPAQNATIKALPDGSTRFIATILATYITFGYTLYSIRKDFTWFIAQRHAWLKRFHSRNYTILVRNIPLELRSDQLLKAHFQRLYGDGQVLVAHMCVHLSNLLRLQKTRSKCILDLEHALAQLALRGKRPKHLMFKKAIGKTAFDRNEKCEVDAIDFFTNELKNLNEAIEEQINAVEKKQRPDLARSLGLRSTMMKAASADRQGLLSIDEKENDDDEADCLGPSGDAIDLDDDTPGIVESSGSLKSQTAARVSSLASDAASTLSSAGHAVKSKAIKKVKKRARQANDTVRAAADVVSSAVLKEKDGTADDAGFVTFTSLIVTHSALQVSQHSQPYVLETVAAPDEPRHIFWGNVGKDKEVLNSGRFISLAATVGICIFWTFVVNFIVGLQNMDDAGAQTEFVDAALSVLSPLLLIVFNSGLLPIILKAVSRFECPPSDSLLEASAFWKMTTFNIIQTFFVTLLSGSILPAIESLFRTPIEFLKLVSNAIPERSGYFMQIIIVSTCIGSLMELFRVVPLVQSVARANLGRRLTEKERSIQVGMLRPLSNVDKIYFSRLQARYTFFFLIFFVYTTIVPLVNWFCLVLFFLVGSVYRYQFIFNYPKTPDSGGTIWQYAVRIQCICLVIAEILILTLLASYDIGYSVAALSPLVVGTCLFINNMDKCYYRIARSLPAPDCLSQDLANTEDKVSFDHFKDHYKIPALMERFVDADWNSGKDVSSRTGITFAWNQERVEKVDHKNTGLSIEDDVSLEEEVKNKHDVVECEQIEIELS